MKGPDIHNRVKDPKTGVRYDVLAYRKLSDDEIRLAIHGFLASEKKPPESGSKITIITSIGAVG